jgi:protease-4
MGGDMFALFARRQRDATARIMHDLEGLLEVRGAQARCLECPGAVIAPRSGPDASAGSPLRWLAALLLD